MNSLYSRRIQNIFSLIFLLLILSACKEPSPNESVLRAVEGLENVSQIGSNGKNYTILVSPSLNKMPLNKYFDMEIDIKGPSKQVIPYKVDVEIDAGMKAHNHGMNVRPNVVSLGNGKFRVEGMLFHMPGEWFISFVIRRGVISDRAEVNTLISL